MILYFPNFDILRLAMTAGDIPENVQGTPARAAFADKGQVWVKSGITLEPDVEGELIRLGVKVLPPDSVVLDQDVCCWAQLLPLKREKVDRLDDRSPVLFQIAEEKQLAEVIGEILRLGNDRQGFRWLAQGENSQALLRVVGPPYYSLLRAVDREGLAGAPIAYREAQPGVWVQLGYRHPLEEHLRLPKGKLLLLRPARHWNFIEEAPFRDIYEVLEFAMPEPGTSWKETELGRRWSIPLRLSQGTTPEPAELWVLRQAALTQVDELVQNADDQLLARLAFAIGESDGERTVVIRVRPSRQPPPVLVLSGIGFRPYLRLPNLFLPTGTRLHPPLRRDVVARLLAGDSSHITWLYPVENRVDSPPSVEGSGPNESPGQLARFIPETLPETTFRPLHDWVDYVLDQEHEALTAWVQAARFEFESFICRDDQPARKPEPREPKAKKPKEKPGPADETEPGSVVPEVRKGKRRKQEEDIAEYVPAQPSEVEQALRLLEKRFLEIDGPLDALKRQALWPRMAQLNSALGQTDSAAICWGHALWEAEDPPAAWLKAWLQAERPQAGSSFSTADLEPILAQADPPLHQVRVLVAALIGAGQEPTSVSQWQKLLGRIPHILERNESLLGVRAVWLSWMALHRLAKGDVLALARARDRLLERLYVSGLSADLDLPNFLRFTGHRASERFRQVRDQVLRLLPLVEKWAQQGSLPVPGTRVYIDLMFAYALARLGETTQARKLVQSGPQRLETHDEVHRWLIAAFEYRVQQALEGMPASGRLPADLLENLHILDRLPRYKIDRLREHSRILEPHEKIDPYRRWHGRFADDLSRELAGLFDVDDHRDLIDRLNHLLAGKGKWARARGTEPRIVATALELAPRLGEAFAVDVLDRCERILDKVAEPLDQALLLEKGLFLAGHYDKGPLVQGLLARFHELIKKSSDTLPVKNLESLLGHTFRSLRKLGLRDDVGRLLRALTESIEQNPAFQSPPEKGQGRREAGSRTSTGQAERQRLLLQIAAGWFYFGQETQARPLLDQARTMLMENELGLVEQTALACAYTTTLGQAPIELALARIMELFRKLEGVGDTYTTQSHFSLSRLDVVEATLLALVSDDFTIAPEARRLLDDDEYLVRRRIHRDMRKALGDSDLK